MTKRWLAAAALLVALGAVAVLVVGDIVDATKLDRYNDRLLAFVEARPVLAPASYVLVYIVAILASIPGAGVCTAVGGYLFGWAGGIAYTLIAQMVGAMTVFLVARRALAGRVLRRTGPRLRALRDGFAEDALSYLFVLRVIGLLPAFMVNAVPGALRVPLGTFALGTALGLIPGTVVYAGIGAGLGDLLAAEEALSPANVFTPGLVLGLVGLIVLALLPVAYKKVARPRQV
jgi:uncharacterized membrane protein YdjX (TVP38/TMEM64 family)